MNIKSERVDCKLINNELIFKCRFCHKDHHFPNKPGFQEAICREFSGSTYLRYGHVLKLKESKK